MLELARQSKVDVANEVRSLNKWITDYDNYSQKLSDGTLIQELPFERIKDVLKTMYLSPIDFGELFFKLKDRVDTGEMIKINLKTIFSEHETMVQMKKSEDVKPRRLRYNRIAFDLKLYKKQCKLQGIKEIEQAQEKVNNSLAQLKEVKDIISNLDLVNVQENINEKRDKIEQAKNIINEIEIDMEEQENEARRLIFEADLKIIFHRMESENKKIHYEEFKDLEKIYDKLRNYVKDENVISKFIQIKNKVSEYYRKINKLENKDSLE